MIVVMGKVHPIKVVQPYNKSWVFSWINYDWLRTNIYTYKHAYVHHLTI